MLLVVASYILGMRWDASLMFLGFLGLSDRPHPGDQVRVHQVPAATSQGSALFM